MKTNIFILSQEKLWYSFQYCIHIQLSNNNFITFYVIKMLSNIYLIIVDKYTISVYTKYHYHMTENCGQYHWSTSLLFIIFRKKFHEFHLVFNIFDEFWKGCVIRICDYCVNEAYTCHKKLIIWYCVPKNIMLSINY